MGMETFDERKWGGEKTKNRTREGEKIGNG